MKIVEEINLENELDEENLEEAKFEYGGSTYSFAFGRYRKDGKEITRDEYKKASDAYKGSKKSNGSALKVPKKNLKKNRLKILFQEISFQHTRRRKEKRNILKNIKE